MISFDHENALHKRGIRVVAGVDEAGRGPLAGPVVAAAVVFRDQTAVPDGLDDSKKMTASRRERVFAEITASPHIRFAIARAETSEIDRLNILRATHLAMRRAVEQLADIEHALVDGLAVRGLPVAHTAIVRGDAASFSIAAASVLAKVTRDRLMLDLDARYPQYGFARHKGYGTKEHLQQLDQHGPCPQHRRSFAPVAQARLF